MESREVEASIPVILCVDVEPDPREVDSSCADAWAGFEKLLPAVERLRHTLSAVTGTPAHFTWALRMDPQVAETWGNAGWLADAYNQDWTALTAAGDELALHPHPWRRDTAGGWISDQGDEDWVASCVHLALEAYRESFGRPCASYRQGDRAMSTALARLLDEAGVAVDLTMEPGLPGSLGLVPDEQATGWIEGTVSAPTVPYRPSLRDFRVPDTGRRDGLLMIPLTRALDIEPATGADRVRPSGRWTTLILWADPATFRARLLRRLAEPVVTHLAFAIRSDLSLQPEWSAFEANIAELCRHPLAPHLRWCTASEAARLLAPATGDAHPGNRVASSSSRRAGLWAGGAEDPGYVEGAEVDALELVGLVAARHQKAAGELAAALDAESRRAQDLAAALDAERARARELAYRLDLAEDDRRALRATTTWRAHDALLPVLRLLRRLVPRR